MIEKAKEILKNIDRDDDGRYFIDDKFYIQLLENYNDIDKNYIIDKCQKTVDLLNIYSNDIEKFNELMDTDYDTVIWDEL